MNWKELATIKNSYDKRKELIEFEKMLKEKPLQESEYRSLIDESNIPIKERIDYYNHIKALRREDMIIDDVPEPFEDFTARAEKQGKIAIKSSVMKQMSQDEFKKLTSKQFALYDDIHGADNVHHYRYRTKSGYVEKTGDGVSVKLIDTNDVQKINEATKSHQQAKETISKTLEEIAVNGNKYNDFMKNSNE